MTENIFERLARKIEQAKARGEREAVAGLKPGFGRNAAGGLTYEAKVKEEPAKAPAAPPAPSTPLQQKLGELAGVWRRTSEHKPPHAGRFTTKLEGDRTESNEWLWDGENWVHGGMKACGPLEWYWLDTSGEFKVGDRVRVKDGVESIYCKPGMVGTVKIAGRSVWFRADGEETDFCATDWLEHALDAPQSN